MHRRLAAAAAALVALAGLPPSGAAGPPRPADACPAPVLTTWLLRARGPKPKPLTVRTRLVPATPDAMIVFVATRGRGSRRVVVDDAARSRLLVTGAQQPWATAYSDGRSTLPPVAAQGPVAAPLCTDTNQYPGEYEVRLDHESRYDYYVMSYGDSQSIRVSPGWTVTRVQGGRVQTVAREQTATGVQATRWQVERFTGTRAVHGGRWGSVAYASLPCDGIPTGVVALEGGWGSGELVGGGPLHYLSHRKLRCESYLPFTIAGASGPTTWRLRGEATGFAATPVRLAVVDLPPP